MPDCTCRTPPPFKESLCRSFRLQRPHVDGETVFHIRLEQSVVGFVHLLDGNNFHIGRDVMRAAKIEHLLSLSNTADGRTGEATAAEDQAEGRDPERLLRCTDQ